MTDQPIKLAQPAHLFDIAAQVFVVRERDISLYARYLREYGQAHDTELWPAISRGREIGRAHV